MTTHKRECIYRSEDKEIFSSLDHDKEALWKDAYKRRIFLLGKEETIRGEVVDWATFDLVVATSHFNDRDFNPPLKLLKKFWRMLWPYMANIIQGYEELQVAWDALVEDQDEVLVGYADQNIEIRAYKDFMAECDPLTQTAFKDFYAQRKKEDEERMEEIRKREKAKSSSILSV